MQFYKKVILISGSFVLLKNIVEKDDFSKRPLKKVFNSSSFTYKKQAGFLIQSYGWFNLPKIIKR